MEDFFDIDSFLSERGVSFDDAPYQEDNAIEQEESNFDYEFDFDSFLSERGVTFDEASEIIEQPKEEKPKFSLDTNLSSIFEYTLAGVSEGKSLGESVKDALSDEVGDRVEQFIPDIIEDQFKAVYSSFVRLGKSSSDILEMKAKFYDRNEDKIDDDNEALAIGKTALDPTGMARFFKSSYDAIFNDKEFTTKDLPVINVLESTISRRKEAIKKQVPVIREFLNFALPKSWEKDVAKAMTGKKLPNSVTDWEGYGETVNTWSTFLADNAIIMASTAVGGPVLGLPVSATATGGEFISSARDAGFSDEQIEKHLNKAMIVNGSLEYVADVATLGLGKAVPKKAKAKVMDFLGKKVIGRVIAHLGVAGFEGLTEYSQNAVNNYFMGQMAQENGVSPEKAAEMFKNPDLLDSDDFIIGFGTSLIIGGGSAALNSVDKKIRTRYEKALENVIPLNEVDTEKGILAHSSEGLDLLEGEYAKAKAEIEYQTEMDIDDQEKPIANAVNDLNTDEKSEIIKNINEKYEIEVDPETLRDADGRYTAVIADEIESVVRKKEEAIDIEAYSMVLEEDLKEAKAPIEEEIKKLEEDAKKSKSPEQKLSIMKEIIRNKHKIDDLQNQFDKEGERYAEERRSEREAIEQEGKPTDGEGEQVTAEGDVETGVEPIEQAEETDTTLRGAREVDLPEIGMEQRAESLAGIKSREISPNDKGIVSTTIGGLEINEEIANSDEFKTLDSELRRNGLEAIPVTENELFDGMVTDRNKALIATKDKTIIRHEIFHKMVDNQDQQALELLKTVYEAENTEAFNDYVYNYNKNAELFGMPTREKADLVEEFAADLWGETGKFQTKKEAGKSSVKDYDTWLRETQPEVYNILDEIGDRKIKPSERYDGEDLVKQNPSMFSNTGYDSDRLATAMGIDEDTLIDSVRDISKSGLRKQFNDDTSKRAMSEEDAYYAQFEQQALEGKLSPKQFSDERGNFSLYMDNGDKRVLIGTFETEVRANRMAENFKWGDEWTQEIVEEQIDAEVREKLPSQRVEQVTGEGLIADEKYRIKLDRKGKFSYKKYDGINYFQKQVEEMKAIQKKKGMTDQEIGEYWTKNYAKKFAEHHRPNGDTSKSARKFSLIDSQQETIDANNIKKKVEEKVQKALRITDRPDFAFDVYDKVNKIREELVEEKRDIFGKPDVAGWPPMSYTVAHKFRGDLNLVSLGFMTESEMEIQAEQTKIQFEKDYIRELWKRVSEVVAPIKQEATDRAQRFVDIHKATLENGGGTFANNGNNMIGTDFIAISPFPEKSLIVDKDKFKYEDIEWFYEENGAALESYPSLKVGTWLNEEEGKVYIDLVGLVPDWQIDEAVRLGKKYNQIGVFNLKTGEFIDTGGTGESKKFGISIPARAQEIEDLGVGGSIESQLKGEKVVNGRVRPRLSKSVKLYHYSPMKDITSIHPKMYGRGLKGAEAARKESAKGTNLWVDRTYYGGAAYRPENLGDNKYTVIATDNFYDMKEDKDDLYVQAKSLAMRELYEAFNKKRTDKGKEPISPQSFREGEGFYYTDNDILTAYERLIKEAGYEFAYNPDDDVAIAFYPHTPVGEFDLKTMEDKERFLAEKVDPESESFKKWQGENPTYKQIVYHGTASPVDFTQFYANTVGLIFMSTKPDASIVKYFANSNNGRIYPVYVNVQNTFDPRSEDSLMKLVKSARKDKRFKSWLTSNFESMAIENKKYLEYYNESSEKDISIFDLMTDKEIVMGITGVLYDSESWSRMETEEFLAPLQKAGFDSLKTYEMGDENIAVFRPENIKSAILNNGNFDPKNPMINFSLKNKTQIREMTGQVKSEDFKNLNFMVRKMADSAKTAEKWTREEINNAQKELSKFASKLPLAVKSKAVGKFPQLSKVKDPELRKKKVQQIVSDMTEAMNEYERYNAVKSLESLVLKERKRIKNLKNKKGGKGTVLSNNYLAEYIDNLTSIGSRRMRNIMNAQAKFEAGEIKKMPAGYEKDLEAIARGAVNIQEMSLRDAMYHYDYIKGLQTEGNIAGKKLLQKTEAQRNATAALAAMEILKTKKSKDIPDDLKIFQNVERHKDIRGYFWDSVRPERIVEWFTGFKQGVFKQEVFDRVLRGEEKEMIISEENDNVFTEIYGDINIRDVANETLGELKGSKVTANQLMFIYANSFNDQNKQHLLDSGLSEQDIADAKKMLPKKYRDMVDKQIKYYDTRQYDAVNEVFEKEYKISMDKVDGYFPTAQLDRQVSEEPITMEDLQKSIAENYASHLQEGMTKQRMEKTKSGFKNADYFGTVLRNRRDVTRYLAYAEELTAVRRFLHNPMVRRAMISKNEVATRALDTWFGDVVDGRINKRENGFTKLIDFARMRYVTKVLGFNVKTVLKQVPSFITGLKDLPLKYQISAMSNLARPFELNKLVNEKSVVMRYRDTQYERVVNELHNRERGNYNHESKVGKFIDKVVERVDQVSEFSMRPITIMDKYVTVSLWKAKYDEMIDLGKSEKVAIKKADELIRKTQPQFGLAHSSAFQRAGGIAKLLTAFSSQTSQNANMVFELFTNNELSKRKKLKDVAYMALSVAFLAEIEAAFPNLVNMFLGEDDEEEAPTIEDYTEMGVSSFVGSIPVAKQVSQTLMAVLMDESRKLRGKDTKLSDFKDERMRQLLPKVFDPLFDSMYLLDSDEDIDKKIDTAISLLGSITGLPTPAVKRAFKQWGEALDEKDPRYLIYSSYQLNK